MLPSPNDANRLKGIDSLRGLAAMGVVIPHALFISQLGVEYNSWHAEYLVIGVPLFFIISAFSMAIAYPGGVIHSARFANYTIRRILRIAPLFNLILASWIIYLTYLGSPFPKPSTLLANITLLFGLMPEYQISYVPAGWSIGDEVIFYSLFPLIWLRPGFRAAAAFLLFAVYIAWLVNQPRTLAVSDYFYWTNYATNLPYFATGLLVWCVYTCVPKEPRRSLSWGLLAVGLCLTTYLCVYGPKINGQQTMTNPVPIHLILGWALAFALIVLSQAVSPFCLLVNPFTRFLGKISYSLYLSHPLLIYTTGITVWAAGLAPSPGLVVVVVASVTLAVAIPIAWILYFFVEAPFIRLGRRLTT